MLIPFTLSPQVFQFAEAEDRKTRHLLNQFEKQWEKNGLLICHERAFRQLIRQAPKKFQKLWLTMFEKQRKNHRLYHHDAWQQLNFDAPPIPGEKLDPSVCLYIHPQEEAQWQHAAPADDVIRLAEGKEVSRIDFFQQTALSTLEASLRKEKATPYSEVKPYFQSLFQFSREIKLIDRYCGKDIFLKYELNQGIAGVLRFLNWAQAFRPDAAPFKRLTLYTAENIAYSMSDKTLASRPDLLKYWLTPDAPQEIQILRKLFKEIVLLLAPAHAFHDRYLRFDKTAYTLGSGFFCFEGKHKLSDNMGINRFDLEGMAAEERELRHVGEEFTVWPLP